MDFSALIAELRNIANKYHGRDTDANVSTAMYCEMFRKILQKADMGTSSYADQIVILWMTLSQLCNTAGALSACSARDSLYQHIFLLCAKTVLNIKWQQLEEDDQGKQNLRATVEATHGQLQAAGFDRFGLLLQLMDDPWTDPVLSQIMAGEESDSEQAKEYINKEDSLILKLRVEMLIQEKCEEFALNLCDCCLKQEKFKEDLELKQKQLYLLFKLDNTDRLQEECEKITCHTGIKIVLRMEQKETNQAICVRLVQTFLVQDWVNPERNCCTQELLKLWIRHQYLTDKDKDKFVDSVWAIAKLSSTTEQICLLVTGLLKECGLSQLQLYTDLLVFAINFDKGQCEQEMLKGNMEGVKKHQILISNTCKKLSEIYAVINPKIAKIGSLTAFALNASSANLLSVKKIFCENLIEARKHVHGTGLCRPDCNSPECRRKKFIFGKSDRKSKDEIYKDNVNPATLYEIERLLNMLRPYYLNPELSWQKLASVCYKFMAEKGVPNQEKEKEQTTVKEGQVANSILSGCVQYFCDDTGQFIPYRLKSPKASQSKLPEAKVSSTTATPSYPSVSTSSLSFSRTKTVPTTQSMVLIPSNPQYISSTTPFTINASAAIGSGVTSKVVDHQGQSVKMPIQHSKTLNRHSMAELLAQTAIPSTSKKPISPLSVDLANLQQQMKVSALLSETGNKSKSTKSVKVTRPSVQLLSKNYTSTGDSSARSKSGTSQNVFNFISLEDIKKQIMDSQLATANSKIALQIPGTMQTGSSKTLIVNKPQTVTREMLGPNNVKKRGRPRILSTPKTQASLIQSMTTKQGDNTGQAVQIIQQNSLQIHPVNTLQTSVIGQSGYQNIGTSLSVAQGGTLNQGLTLLQTNPSTQTANTSISQQVINQPLEMSRGQIINSSQTTKSLDNSSSKLFQSVKQAAGANTANLVSDLSVLSSNLNLIQKPVQIATVKSINAASGANVFNLLPPSLGEVQTQSAVLGRHSSQDQLLSFMPVTSVLSIQNSTKNQLSSVSENKIPQQQFAIQTVSNASDELSKIKPPAASISTSRTSTDWSVVKPPSSSLHISNRSTHLKTVSNSHTTSVLSSSSLTAKFPPYQGITSTSNAKSLGGSVTSVTSQGVMVMNKPSGGKSSTSVETIPTDVVNLLVQENVKQRSVPGQNLKPQENVKSTERRPSADELKSIVDWLQTGTEDAVTKLPSSVAMSSITTDKMAIGKSQVKSPFTNIKPAGTLVLTPPQTTLTVQTHNTHQFVQSVGSDQASSSSNLQRLHECAPVVQVPKPLVLSIQNQNQLATSALETTLNAGKESSTASEESSAILQSTSSNVNTSNSSNIGTMGSQNLATAVLFPLNNQNSSHMSTVKPKNVQSHQSGVTQLLYLGKVKASALNVGQKVLPGTNTTTVQQWPQIGDVMTSAKQFVQQLYGNNSSTAIVTQIDSGSQNNSGVQSVPASHNTVTMSNAMEKQGLINLVDKQGEQNLNSTTEVSQMVHDVEESTKKSELSVSEGGSNNMEVLAQVVEDELKEIIVNIDTSVAASETSKQSVIRNDHTEKSESGDKKEVKPSSYVSNKMSTSLDSDFTESHIDIESTVNIDTFKAKDGMSEEENEYVEVCEDIEENDDIRANLKTNLQQSFDQLGPKVIGSCNLEVSAAERVHSSFSNPQLQGGVNEISKFANISNTGAATMSPCDDLQKDTNVTQGIDVGIPGETSSDHRLNHDVITKKDTGELLQGPQDSTVNFTEIPNTSPDHPDLFRKASELEQNSSTAVLNSELSNIEDIDLSKADEHHKCLICGKLFNSVDSLKNHVKDICKPITDAEDGFRCIFYCSNCSYSSESKAYMSLHTRDCENTIYSDSKVKLPNILKRFVCQMCGEVCVTEEQINEHVIAGCERNSCKPGNDNNLGASQSGSDVKTGQQSERKMFTNAGDCGGEYNTVTESKGVIDTSVKDISIVDGNSYDVNIGKTTGITGDLDSETTIDLDEKSCDVESDATIDLGDIVEVDIETTTNETDSDKETVAKTLSGKRRKKWFLRNRESRSYEELEENMVKIEEEISNQGEVKTNNDNSMKDNNGNVEVSVVVKRKRGRPRLMKNIDKAEKKLNTDVTVKRKRGRPRIYFNETVNSISKNKDKERLSKENNDKEKLSKIDTSNSSKDKLKRKRGRPRIVKQDVNICYGKRVIKVAKFYSDEYELPDYVIAQAEKSNMKRQFNSKQIMYSKSVKKDYFGKERGQHTQKCPPLKTSMKKSKCKCVKCGQVFRDRNVMLQHIASVHLSPYKSTWYQKKKKFCFLCRYCQNYFNTYIKFLDHVTVHSDKLIKQLERKTFKVTKGTVNENKLARQEQIAALSLDLNKNDSETKKDAHFDKDNSKDSKERLSRSSRASSVSSCNTDTSQRQRSVSRQKLDFSDNSLQSSVDRDVDTVKTRSRAHSNITDKTAVSSGRIEMQLTSPNKQSDSELSKSKAEFGVRTRRFSHCSDSKPEEKIEDIESIRKSAPSLSKEVHVERIISTRGKIYKFGQLENEGRKSEDVTSKQSKKMSDSERDEKSVKNLDTEEKSDDDDSESNIRRTITTRNKTYVYSKTEASKANDSPIETNQATCTKIKTSETSSRENTTTEDKVKGKRFTKISKSDTSQPKTVEKKDECIVQNVEIKTRSKVRTSSSKNLFNQLDNVEARDKEEESSGERCDSGFEEHSDNQEAEKIKIRNKDLSLFLTGMNESFESSNEKLHDRKTRSGESLKKSHQLQRNVDQKATDSKLTKNNKETSETLNKQNHKSSSEMSFSDKTFRSGERKTSDKQNYIVKSRRESGRISTRSSHLVDKTPAGKIKAEVRTCEVILNKAEEHGIKTRSRNCSGSEDLGLCNKNAKSFAKNDSIRKNICSRHNSKSQNINKKRQISVFKEGISKFRSAGISLRNRNLRSAFSSRYEKYGIRSQRLVSRNIKKELTEIKSGGSSKIVNSRLKSIQKTQPSEVKCSMEDGTIKVGKQLNSKKDVVVKSDLEKDSCKEESKRLSTDEELLVAAGCLESNRRLTVKLERNKTYEDNRKKLEVNNLSDNQSEVKTSGSLKNDSEDDTKSEDGKSHKEVENSPFQRKLRDRKTLGSKRKKFDIDADDFLSDDVNDKDYKEEEDLEDSDDESDEEPENIKHTAKEVKYKRISEEMKGPKVIASEMDDEFDYVKSPVSNKVAENLSEQVCKQNVVEESESKELGLKNKTAFIESFKSYIGTKRRSPSPPLVVPKRNRSRTKITQQSDMGSKSDFQVGSINENSEDVGNHGKDSFQEAFLNSFKMYIGKSQGPVIRKCYSESVVSNQEDKEKDEEINVKEVKNQTGNKSYNDTDVRKRSVSENNEIINERKRSASGNIQAANVKKSHITDSDEKDPQNNDVSTLSNSDYLSNFKMYIDKRYDSSPVSDTMEELKNNENKLMIENEMQTANQLSFKNVDFENDTESQYKVELPSGASELVPEYENSEPSVLHEELTVSKNPPTQIQQSGYSFLDSFLAHCGKKREVEEFDSESESVSGSSQSSKLLSTDADKNHDKQDYQTNSEIDVQELQKDIIEENSNTCWKSKCERLDKYQESDNDQISPMFEKESEMKSDDSCIKSDQDIKNYKIFPEIEMKLDVKSNVMCNKLDGDQQLDECAVEKQVTNDVCINTSDEMVVKNDDVLSVVKTKLNYDCNNDICIKFNNENVDVDGKQSSEAAVNKIMQSSVIQCTDDDDDGIASDEQPSDVALDNIQGDNEVSFILSNTDSMERQIPASAVAINIQSNDVSVGRSDENTVDTYEKKLPEVLGDINLQSNLQDCVVKSDDDRVDEKDRMKADNALDSNIQSNENVCIKSVDRNVHTEVKQVSKVAQDLNVQSNEEVCIKSDKERVDFEDTQLSETSADFNCQSFDDAHVTNREEHKEDEQHSIVVDLNIQDQDNVCIKSDEDIVNVENEKLSTFSKDLNSHVKSDDVVKEQHSDVQDMNIQIDNGICISNSDKYQLDKDNDGNSNLSQKLSIQSNSDDLIKSPADFESIAEEKLSKLTEEMDIQMNVESINIKSNDNTDFKQHSEDTIHHLYVETEAEVEESKVITSHEEKEFQMKNNICTSSNDETVNSDNENQSSKCTENTGEVIIHEDGTFKSDKGSENFDMEGKSSEIVKKCKKENTDDVYTLESDNDKVSIDDCKQSKSTDETMHSYNENLSSELSENIEKMTNSDCGNFKSDKESEKGDMEEKSSEVVKESKLDKTDDICTLKADNDPVSVDDQTQSTSVDENMKSEIENQSSEFTEEAEKILKSDSIILKSDEERVDSDMKGKPSEVVEEPERGNTVDIYTLKTDIDSISIDDQNQSTSDDENMNRGNDNQSSKVTVDTEKITDGESGSFKLVKESENRDMRGKPSELVEEFERGKTVDMYTPKSDSKSIDYQKQSTSNDENVNINNENHLSEFIESAEKIINSEGGNLKLDAGIAKSETLGKPTESEGGKTDDVYTLLSEDDNLSLDDHKQSSKGSNRSQERRKKVICINSEDGNIDISDSKQTSVRVKRKTEDICPVKSDVEGKNTDDQQQLSEGTDESGERKNAICIGNSLTCAKELKKRKKLDVSDNTTTAENVDSGDTKQLSNYKKESKKRKLDTGKSCEDKEEVKSDIDNIECMTEENKSDSGKMTGSMQHQGNNESKFKVNRLKSKDETKTEIETAVKKYDAKKDYLKADSAKSSGTDEIDKTLDEESLKTMEIKKCVQEAKSKPVLKSVSCQSGPATVRIPVTEQDTKRSSLRNKSSLTTTKDLRQSNFKSYSGRSSGGKIIVPLKLLKSLHPKPVINTEVIDLELPSGYVNKNSVQLPELTKSPLDTFQDSFETYVQSPTAEEEIESSNNAPLNAEPESKRCRQHSDSKNSALKSFREHCSNEDKPFTWDMEDTVELPNTSDGKRENSKRDETLEIDNIEHKLAVDNENKKLGSPDLCKKSDSCHDDAVSCISDDTKSVCSSSDHTDTESGRNSRTSSVERILPKSCATKQTKVRHIYHHGKIWNIGKGHVTSVPVHQSDELCSVTSNISSVGTLKTESREESKIQVIEVDRKQDQSGNRITGATPQEEYDNLNTYTSREENDLKKDVDSEKPTKRWKIVQGKRRPVSKGGVPYPYVFKKSRRK